MPTADTGRGVVGDAAVISVPAGLFLMGCNTAIDAQCFSDEMPGHTVTLTRAYEIDATEVTQQAYQRCIDASQCTAPSSDFDPGGFPLLPVVLVTWDEAFAYCAWRGRRLPTEAEWELAARGRNGAVFPWGNDAPTCERTNALGCNPGRQDVAQHPAGVSWIGGFDFSGNVWEWTQDFYDATYYQTSPAVDPTGPSTAAMHTMRGGYWQNSADNIRSSVRASGVPAMWLGFRCAVSL